MIWLQLNGAQRSRLFFSAIDESLCRIRKLIKSTHAYLKAIPLFAFKGATYYLSENPEREALDTPVKACPRMGMGFGIRS
ncbi:hypothetical protein KSD_19060 [Ktedonobacter sp. SOSP1-85]|nr:hypothetical protein KSD_19060 [Ktedonobacter sp. SOSP1-85]